MNKETLVSYIDATIVKNNNTFEDVDALIKAAKEYNFKTAFTMPCYTAYLAEALKDTNVGIGGVAGFPWGGEMSEAKALEAQMGVKAGADEIDIVINLGYLFSKKYDLVLKDIVTVRNAVPDTTLKCIIESSMLTKEQIKTATQIVVDSGADFVKCCTGFHGTASLEQVETMLSVTQGKIKIKASGGIRTYSDAVSFINAGADRLGIGFESAVKILNEVID